MAQQTLEGLRVIGASLTYLNTYFR